MKEKVLEAVSLPIDLQKGITCTEVYGNKQLEISNFKSIYSCDAKRIRILASGYAIHIEGENLKIAYYAESCVRIHGLIETLQFVRR